MRKLNNAVKRYLVGLLTFKLLTDHKPLVTLINQKDLYKTPLRCQRLLMRLMRFNPLAEHVPGKHLVVADTLSRSPLKFEEDPDAVEYVQAFVDLVEYTRPFTDNQLKRIKEVPEGGCRYILRVAKTCGGSPTPDTRVL